MVYFLFEHYTTTLHLLERMLVIFQGCRYQQLFCHQVLSDRLVATLRTAAHPASCPSLSPDLPRLMPIELVMPSNHLTLCHPLLFFPSILPSIRVFSNELAVHIRWPKYWSFMILVKVRSVSHSVMSDSLQPHGL